MRHAVLPEPYAVNVAATWEEGYYPFKAGDTVFLALYGGSGNISVAKITRIRSQTDKDSFLTSGFFVVEDSGIETFIAPRLIGQLVFSTHAEALAEIGQRQGNCI